MTVLLLLFLAGFVALVTPVLAVVGPRLISKSRSKKAEIQSVQTPEDELSQAFASAKRSLWGEKSPEIRAKVERLYLATMNLQPRLSDLGSSTYHTVVSTGTKYLPDAVNSYLCLPQAVRDTVPVDGQKTAKDLLCEQLDIMNAELKKVLDEAQKVDATDLIVHGRFLEEKYGKAEPVSEDILKTDSVGDALESKIRTAFGVPNIALGTKGIRHYGLDGSMLIDIPRADYVKEGDLPVEARTRVNESIPAGKYAVEVVDVEMVSTRGGRQGFQLTLVVSSGQFGGHRLWQRLILTDSVQGLKMFSRQMEALGVPYDPSTIRWMDNATALSMFLGRRAYARVTVDEYRGRLRNSISTLTSASDHGMVAA